MLQIAENHERVSAAPCASHGIRGCVAWRRAGPESMTTSRWEGTRGESRKSDGRGFKREMNRIFRARSRPSSSTSRPLRSEVRRYGPIVDLLSRAALNVLLSPCRKFCRRSIFEAWAKAAACRAPVQVDRSVGLLRVKPQSQALTVSFTLGRHWVSHWCFSSRQMSLGEQLG